MPKQLDIARAEIGVTETAGPKATKRIVDYFAAAGSDVKSDEVAWCSAFMCWVLEKAGYASTNNLSARSWLKYGKPSECKPGAIAILPRGNKWQGHVTMVEEILPGGYFFGIGGNQANSVSRARFKIKDALAFRWPNTVGNSGTIKGAGAAGLGLIGTGYVAVKPLVDQAQESFPTSTYVAIAALVVGAIGVGIVIYRRWKKL